MVLTEAREPVRLMERLVYAGTRGGGGMKNTGGKGGAPVRRRNNRHCPETSVPNYQTTLCNVPEEQRTQLHCCGGPKSRRSEDLRDRAKRVCT